MASTGKNEKPHSIRVEDSTTADSCSAEEKHVDESRSGAADYSGAVKKSSPEEIRLVRKLDRRIMGILWAMYFLVCLFISNACWNVGGWGWICEVHG